MAEIRCLLFDSAGEQNTDATLRAAVERMQARPIDRAQGRPEALEGRRLKHVVVATSTGATALKLARLLPGAGANIVGVTLQAGLWQKYGPPDRTLIQQAESMGVKIFTGTHALMGNVDSAMRDKFGGIAPSDLIAYVYYTFSQGMKVAVEVACMACDAGLVPLGEEIVAIAGSNTGADTAIVLTATPTSSFFDLKIHEILAMPR